MRIYRMAFIALVLAAMAIPALAVTNVVPNGTVVPVVLDNELNSRNSRVGDTFTAHSVTASGFPVNTVFSGRVEQVLMPTNNSPGEIDVAFVSADLPDGTSVAVDGQLTALDSKSVKTDPASGRLVATSEARKANSKFIAYGAGAGFLLGELLGDRPLVGAIIGAAAGYLYGQQQAKAAYGRDVVVPTGTKVGVLLNRDVALMDTPPTAVGGVATPAPGGAVPSFNHVTYGSLKPVMVSNELLVPLRHTMNSLSMPFDYDAVTKTVRVTSGTNIVSHTIGTRLLYDDGTAFVLAVPSRIIRGTAYVPAGFIERLTGKSTFYNYRTGILRIE